MKKICNLFLNCINITLIFLLVCNFINLDKERESIFIFKKDFEINSKFLLTTIKEDEKINIVEIEEKTPIEEIKKDEEKDLLKENHQDIDKENIIEKKDESHKVIESFTGTISGYGPDCYGCTSNKTASGYFVGNGNINYYDSLFGNVRIVAADYKYPFGSIVKISGYNEDIIAIVLDRGGSIGLNKKVQFDLLFSKESEASFLGLQNDILFEILRIGY